jgi:Spy/CpxP family protein refolding chaperone
MTTRNQRFFILAAAALLLTGALYARTSTTTPERGARRLEFVSGYLNLTDTQKTQAKAIFEDTRTAAQPVMDDLKSLHDQMATAVKANNTATIDSLSLQVGKDAATLAALRMKGLARFYAILTPEQQAKAEKLHGQFQGMIAGRRAHRFGF